MSGSGDSAAVSKSVVNEGAKNPYHDGLEKSPVDKPADTSATDAEMAEASAVLIAEKPIKHLQYKEIEGDLFQCPDTSSLAHCVSKDLCMSKGIASIFKTKFGRVNELKRQAKNVGECAVLQFPSRYIYYLITKEIYRHKPTYANLEASLVWMKEHCQTNGVKELCMPQIACGLDRLVWKQVSAIIQKVFANVDISITVYTFNKTRQ